MFVKRLPAVKAVIAMLVLSFLLLPQAIHALEADGEYTIGFNIMHADKRNASIAEGYWDQPAKLIVQDGRICVRTTINKHAWVTGFATRYNGTMTDVKTISVDEGANERLTEFQIANVTDLVESHVSVTIDEMNYDHSYTMYFKFNPDTLTLVKAAEGAGPSASSPASSPAATAVATAIPKATSTPASTPAASHATPAASLQPTPSAGSTHQAATSPSSLSDAEEAEPERTDSSDSAQAEDANPEAAQNDEVAEAASSANSDIQAGEGASSELAAEAGSAEAAEIEESDTNRNGMIFIIVLIVLVAAAAAIVFKTRHHKK